jgi:Ca2+-binding RTX toxin-like protein
MTRSIRAAILALVVGGATLIPGTMIRAGTNPTCTYAAGTVNVTLSQHGQAIFVRRQSGSQNIEFFTFGPVTITCSGGTPTVDNTDTINITDTTTGGSTVTDLMLVNGPFAPGATGEPGGSDEIEFNVSVGDGFSDQLILHGSDLAADHLTFGQAGINLNANEPAPRDADVTYSGVDSTDQITGAGPDVVDGSGGDGTGAVFDIKMQVQSGDGNDTVVGGTVADSIRPEGFATSNSNDTLDGGPGFDRVDYLFEPDGVKVNLAAGTTTGAGTDDLTSLEEVYGSDTGNDVLTGNNRRNVLDGAGGHDRLSGGPGDDFLAGGDGRDTIVAKSSPSIIDLAAGTSTDARGADTLSGIENAVGGPGPDSLNGTDSINRLSGAGGNDRFEGLGGNDVVAGGGGGDRAFGGPGDDRLGGGAGNDRLFGQGDDDRLDGGPNHDLCAGGPGADTRVRCEA